MGAGRGQEEGWGHYGKRRQRRHRRRHKLGAGSGGTALTPEPQDGSAESAAAGQERALERARFIDRFVAFSIDYILVLLISYGVLFTFLEAVKPAPSSHKSLLIAWLVLWFGGWLGYHVWFSLDGRATIGKRLLGLQVFTQEGYPLPLKAAVLRALGYIASSVLFGLGFVWALFSSRNLAWHDSLSGTMVLETRPKTGLRRAAIALAAVVFLVLDGIMILWPVAAKSYSDMKHRANAEAALAALASYEQSHKKATGAYTQDLAALGRQYGDLNEFTLRLSQTLDIRSLRITATRDRFTISANALDGSRTAYEVSSPATTSPPH